MYEQNVERATRSELWAQGEEVRLSWSPDHTFVVRANPAGTTTGATMGDSTGPATSAPSASEA